MAEDTSQAAKIATACIVMVAIVFMAVTLMWVSKSFLNQQVHTYDMAISQAKDAQASFLGSYSKPVPVASVLKVIEDINYGAEAGASRIASFKIYSEKLGVQNEDDAYPISTDDADIIHYLDQKCYFGWELDDLTGTYSATMIIHNMDHDTAAGRLA